MGKDRLTLREALELVRDCSSQEWQRPDGKRMAATDNQGLRFWFITENVMQAVRDALGMGGRVPADHDALVAAMNALRDWRPKYGEVGTRDVDVTRAIRTRNAAIEALGRVLESAHGVLGRDHQTFSRQTPTENG